MVESSASPRGGTDKRHKAAVSWSGAALRALIGLVLLAVVTGVYLVERNGRYSDLPKAKPPRPVQVGDDFARLAEATNDPRSVYLVIGQALYDRGRHVRRIVIPADITAMLAKTSRPGGPTVTELVAKNRIYLLTGTKPRELRYPARLNAEQTSRILKSGRLTEYPMGVVVADNTDSAQIAEWAVVGSSDGERAIILPAEQLQAVIQ